MKKTGLFFGSFNPIHIGHMVIAGYMAEFADLDEVWFVVSPQNPFKKKQSLLADHHRYRLADIAAEAHPKLRVSNIEFSLPVPSYTIDTLAHLNEKYPDHRFSLIMGADNLQTLHKWKNYERILENYPVLVYPRPGYAESAPAGKSQVIMTEAPLMDISATMIRKALRDKKNVSFLLPPGVYDYIREMHFYEK